MYEKIKEITAERSLKAITEDTEHFTPVHRLHQCYSEAAAQQM